MPQHGKTARRRAEGLGFFVDGPPRPPPPGLMHERPVRRVHQPNDRVVNMARKFYGFAQARHPVAKFRHDGRVTRINAVIAEKDPDIALHFSARVGLHLHPVDIELLIRYQRGDGRASPVAAKAPAMVTAFDFLAVERTAG